MSARRASRRATRTGPPATGSTPATGRAPATTSCGCSAAPPAAPGSGARSGSATAATPSRSAGSRCGPEGVIFSWERAWHPVHRALRRLPLRDPAGRAAPRRRRPHGRQPRRRPARPSRSAPRSGRVRGPRQLHLGAVEDFMTTDANSWRTETPGSSGWPRTARAGDPHKYFVVSADTHANEPAGLWAERIDAKYKSRVPRVEVDANGVKWSGREGFRPTKLRASRFEGEDLIRSRAGADPEERLRDLKRRRCRRRGDLSEQGSHDVGDRRTRCSRTRCAASTTSGPGRRSASTTTCSRPWRVWRRPTSTAPSPRSSAARGSASAPSRCRANPSGDRTSRIAATTTCAEFDPLWACVQATGMPITFHVSTGRDPRAARGEGGAVINYVVHSLAPTIEPVVNLCASGVLERSPGSASAPSRRASAGSPGRSRPWTRATASTTCGRSRSCGLLPSEYFRRQGFASFQEDAPGLELVERFGLVDNFLWANDYPHHEGTWPHSAQAIERTMGGLDDGQRAKILGLNAAKLFGFVH